MSKMKDLSTSLIEMIEDGIPVEDIQEYLSKIGVDNETVIDWLESTTNNLYEKGDK